MILYCLTPIILLVLAAILTRRNQGLSRGVKLLYLVIFWLEIPGSFVRAAISWFVIAFIFTPLWIVFALIVGIAWVMALAGGGNSGEVVLHLVPIFLTIGGGLVGLCSVIAGFGPLVLSLLSMLGFRGGYKETAWEVGGRRLSKTREAVKFAPAIAHIQTIAKCQLNHPAAVFAIDNPLPRAFTVGSTLFMTSALLKSKHVMPLVCRELYYMQSGDARFILALRRLVMPPMYLLSRLAHRLAPGNLAFSLVEAANERYMALFMYIATFLGALAGGGIGIVMMSPLIVRYLRKAQERANIFATEIGVGSPLADYYEDHAYFDFAVPYIYQPLASTELQIDDIIRWQRGERWAI